MGSISYVLGTVFRAKSVFRKVGIIITTEGRRHLATIVGSEAFNLECVNNKLDEWIKKK